MKIRIKWFGMNLKKICENNKTINNSKVKIRFCQMSATTIYCRQSHAGFHAFRLLLQRSV